MSTDSNDAIPLTGGDNQPIPVPPPKSVAPQPVPIPPPSPQPMPITPGAGSPPPVPQTPSMPTGQEDEPILLVDEGETTTHVSHKKKMGMGVELTEFKRQLNVNGQGATRCRIFKSKLAEGPLTHMEHSINQWLDENEIEIKHVTQCIGTLEGKSMAPNMIVTVWY